MRASFKTRLAAFWRDKAANVAVGFAVTMLPVTAGVAGGVDYTRAASIGAEIQTALDSGVLAAASLTQDRDPEAVVRSYVEAALAEHGALYDSLNVTISSDLAVNSRRVVAQASVNVPTVMLGIAGIGSIPVSRVSEALEEVQNIEISLVLDISSSMSGSKVDNLREASLDFVDTMLDGTAGDLTSISVVPYGGTVKLDGSFYRFITDDDEFQLPGYDWEIEVPDADDWNGCIEMNDTEVRTMAMPAQGFGVIPEFTVWNRNNPWCPDHPDAEAVFLSNNTTRLTDVIGSFDNPALSDGTGTDIAISWGMRGLDPMWRGGLNGDAGFSDRPADFDDAETLKVLVVMTDGGITSQRRPDDDFDPEDDDGRHVGTRGTDDYYKKNKASQAFTSVCNYAKNNGVVVYSIAFQVNGSSNRNLLQNCASTPSNYYNVEDLDIASAFSSIAADLNMLRLAR
ncbi:MAG: TadE/TadG family type IV pilus assembly protein [Pseudomonadota bacterium]